MSDKKPGLFSRIKNTISSSLTDAVDSMSDPGTEVALMLDDLATQIQEAEKDLRQAVVDRKVMERKLEQIAKDEGDWAKRAEQALRLGDENLARQALKRKGELSVQKLDLETAVQEQGSLAESMQHNVTVSKQKLKMLNLRRGSLMAQARAAKRGVGGGRISDGGTVSRINEIESRIASLEALNEIEAEMSPEVQEAEVDAKLASLGGDAELDDALSALKAKLAAQQALPAADTSKSKGEG